MNKIDIYKPCFFVSKTVSYWLYGWSFPKIEIILNFLSLIMIIFITITKEIMADIAMIYQLIIFSGWVNKFLSYHIFEILSKLSYCMYLLHLQVQLTSIASLRTPQYFTNIRTVRNTQNIGWLNKMINWISIIF